MSTPMQQSGYQSQSRFSPAAIGGVVLVHAGLGAVILTMSVVHYIPDVVKPIWAWNIPKEQPKPEPTDARPSETPRGPRVTTSDPTVKMPVPTYGSIVTPTIFPDPGSGGAGTGPLVFDPVPPPPLPQPVMVQARIDSRFASGFQPPYPAAMLRQQREGAVTVRVTIGSDGRVIDVALVSTADPAFFEATRRQALSRWRFVPATRDGVAVSSEKVMTVHFRLTD
ncbi:TonB family protein [Sphingobium sufflavum]|uniref:energy transducer TonB n=1 Tax=Sphingobium sufflavum TaxID=1129547 RepID=UPI001F1B9D99|nr:energy transducer TonB [Sphingobium sufflavum]MCE7798599.1 TonB family protein [Sphingobium sufflavum]